MKIELRKTSDSQPRQGTLQFNDGAAGSPLADEPERWAPISAFEGLYEVSSLGRVRRSSPSRTAPSGYFLRPHLTHDGYVKFALFKTGRYRHVTAHRLVALAFLGTPPFPNAQAAHFDGDKKNNRVSNLRWATAAENQADKKRHGTARGARFGERRHQARLNNELVAAMRRDVVAGMTVAAVACKFGVRKVTAYDAIIGKTWTTVTDPEPLGLIRRRAS